ncbi:hypothetical protein PCAR4_460193 [Paraburkholderia caribensis]|nr:hypothetical protein PCAR4_460193 [Paraburkholderia caribensis]
MDFGPIDYFNAGGWALRFQLADQARAVMNICALFRGISDQTCNRAACDGSATPPPASSCRITPPYA